MVFVALLVSCGCHKKLSHTRWIKPTKIYSLKVLESRRLKPSRSVLPPGALGRIRFGLFLILVVAGITPVFVSVGTWSSLLSIISLASVIRTLVVGFRVHPVNPRQSHLKILNLNYI